MCPVLPGCQAVFLCSVQYVYFASVLKLQNVGKKIFSKNIYLNPLFFTYLAPISVSECSCLKTGDVHDPVMVLFCVLFWGLHLNNWDAKNVQAPMLAHKHQINKKFSTHILCKVTCASHIAPIIK